MVAIFIVIYLCVRARHIIVGSDGSENVYVQRRNVRTSWHITCIPVLPMTSVLKCLFFPFCASIGMLGNYVLRTYTIQTINGDLILVHQKYNQRIVIILPSRSGVKYDENKIMSCRRQRSCFLANDTYQKNYQIVRFNFRATRVGTTNTFSHLLVLISAQKELLPPTRFITNRSLRSANAYYSIRTYTTLLWSYAYIKSRETVLIFSVLLITATL